jgi:hypothetical protein
MTSALARTAGQDVETTPSKRRIAKPPTYDGSSRPVQGSEWMVYVRDHDIALTMDEWALGTLYGTYGNWGQKAYPSDNWIGKRFGKKPETVSKIRKSLVAKGLLRCIGSVPGQPNQFVYCLTLPVEIEGGIPSTGDTGIPSPVDTGIPSPGGTVSPLRGDQELEELDIELHSSSARDDGAIGSSTQNPGLTRGSLADSLGAPVRDNVWSLATRLASEYGPDAVLAAAQQSAETGRNPAAYFLTSAEDMCDRYTTERVAEVQAVTPVVREDAESRRLAAIAAKGAELESLKDQIMAKLPGFMKNHPVWGDDPGLVFKRLGDSFGYSASGYVKVLEFITDEDPF